MTTERPGRLASPLTEELGPEARAEIVAQFGVALDSATEAFKSFGASCETSASVFAALGDAARLADIDARAEARARRLALREHFGWLCVLTPEWWTLRRLERHGFGA